MTEMCFPAAPCGPNVVTWPSSVGGGVPPPPTEYDIEPVLMCEPSPSTAKVLVTLVRSETAAPGTPPVVEAYNFPAMTPYAGSVAALVQCPSPTDIESIQSCYQDAATGNLKFTRVEWVDTSTNPPTSMAVQWRNASGAVVAAPAGIVPCQTLESDQVAGCASGIAYTQWAQKDTAGRPTGVVWYTNAAGTIVAAPLGFVPGPCPDVVLSVTPGGTQIAGPVRAASPAFAGAVDTWDTSAAGGALHSFTVDAAGVADGLPGQTANQILVDMPDGTTIALGNGRVRSFSVVRDQDSELRREFRVRATGNAHAIITYTFV